MDMFGLTTLGTIHTAISLVALIAGYWALIRDKRIAADTTLGRVYVWTTVLTCLTGFGIFEHGGFGKPHALGIITLVVLAIAAWPAGVARFGQRWNYLVTACYTLTLFFHMVPGVTETFTRLPLGAPLFTGPEDPRLERLVGGIFVLFVAVIVWQLRHQRSRGRAAAVGKPA
jgi:uncharacterized membrane protein